MAADAIISLLGLFVINTNTPVPLTGVNYDVTVNGFASQININQTYKNTEATDIECVYGFPINDYASITGFVVKIDDRVISSQFKKKDEAFKEYSDAIKRGDGAYLLDQSDQSDDTFVFSVGRLLPNKECTISISYVATLEFVTENKLRFVIPTALYPRYNPDAVRKQLQGLTDVMGNQDDSNNTDSAKSSVLPPNIFQSTVPYKATLNAAINMFSPIEKIASTTHSISVSLQSNNTNVVKVTFGAEEQALDRDIVLEIDVRSLPEHHVDVEQTGPNEFAAMYSYVPKFDSGKDQIKAEIIFVLDCSGSMDEERKIDDARRALKIFLRSLPQGSYFNFYRFGSEFESLFPDSTLYNADSFAKAEEYADGSSATLGGTEMLPPLAKIYDSPPRPNFVRQVFVLTDGEVTNTNEVIDLVRKNVYNTRLFSFGLGNSPSRTLVNGIALAGNGKSEFIRQGDVLEDKIGRQLRRALQPAVSDAMVSWMGVGKLTQAPTVMPPVFRGERQLSFAIFKQQSVEQRSGKKAVVLTLAETKIETAFTLPQSSPSDYRQMIAKLAARAMIKDLENRPTIEQMKGLSPTGSLQQRGKLTTDSPTPRDSTQDKITDISLSYGILSKYVSLVAVEKREISLNSTIGRLKLIEIPVQKVSKRDQSSPVSMYGWASSAPSDMDLAFDDASGAFNRDESNDPDGPVPPVDVEVSTAVLSAAPLMKPKTKSGSRRKSFESDTFSADSASEITTTSALPATSESSTDDEEPTTTIPATSNSSKRAVNLTLNGLLTKQQWDGSWKYDDDLARSIGVPKDQLSQVTSKSPLNPDALPTILIVEFITEKYPKGENIWRLLVDKALMFLDQTVSSKNELQKLIHAVKSTLPTSH